ncbi:hypothetical protein EX30DRAFT_397746 [Ascodesmis nigricans]|uniref:GYF domain-containing protein n=1 Tax=Ascodesmis nigricans TaxID=341454 RepID=A0A4S2MRJ9_9PEZI|nr:hypothetical protein EX30DRAFT_397746 [Ascodesmis nigricans]
MSSSHFSSFSSAAGKDAAASNHPGSSSSSGGGGVSLGSSGGAGSGDWTRRVNGNSSSTTRRPSLSTTLTHTTTPLSSGSSNVYHPPHHYNRQGAGGSTTYGKEDLLNIFKSQEGSGGLEKVDGLLESELNGSGAGGWGRSGDEAINGVELCWEKDGGLKPIGLDEMTEEERELFSGSVNSPHKPANNNSQGNNTGTPTQNRNKAGSIGATPGSSRPQTGRRRETSDAGLNLFNGSPNPLSRRRNDLRDGDEVPSPSRERTTFFGRWGSTPSGDDDKDKDDGPGGTGGRNTGLFRRPSAAWGPSTGGSTLSANGALNSPMGTFGNSPFGGGAMGGFMLQSDKSKTSSTTNKNSSSNRPGVENVEEHAEESLPEAVSSTIAELREEENRERPMTGETDPFGSGDHGRDQRPASLLEHDRMKSGSPFGDLSVSTSNQRPGSNVASTPTRQRSDFGFSAFGSRDGFGSSGMTGLTHQLQNLQFNQQGQVPLRRSREGSLGGALAGENEPLSPAETNPFTSPPPEKADDDGTGNESTEGGGLGSVIAGLRRGEGAHIGQGSDRSGRSSTAGIGSVGGPLGGGPLGGFGGLGGSGLWGSGQLGTPGGIGSSSAQSALFGSGPLGDFGTPGGNNLLSGGLGGIGSGLGGSGFGSASRASRLGPLFQDTHHDEPGYESDAFKSDPRFGAFGSRSRLGMMESPMRERGDVADLFGFPSSRSLSNLAGTAAAQDAALYQREAQDSLAMSQGHQNQQSSPPNAQSLPQPGQPLRPPPGNLPLGTVPHVLLMPDKISWEYRDPTGTVQGPFSGLEMHEWYRAGFFTSELAVKRVEDSDFEPLGTLVRRIGNTREPFLVPLPGSAAAGMSTVSANWSESRLNDLPGAAAQSSQPQASTTPGSIQPPFAGSFPTFGTTLTAEQQNNLERRKQEEQYLMAKQREYLLQQQMMLKHNQLREKPSSASIQSQPSFGNLHSPNTFGPAVSTPAAVLVGNQNAFEPGLLIRQAGAAACGSDVLGLSAIQTPGSQFPQQPLQHGQQALQLQQEQQRLVEQQRQQQLHRNYQSQQTAHAEQQLQKAQEQVSHQQEEQQQYVESQPSVESLRDQASFQEQSKSLEQQHQDQQQQKQEQQVQEQPAQPKPAEQPKPVPAQEKPKAASAAKTPSVKSSPAPSKPSQPAWNQPQPLVAPFPPPPSQEPAVPSPSIEPAAPSIAPWANKDEAQPLKTPSLKEIQELEAKQAAARQAAEEQARAAMLAAQPVVQAPPPAPGLPSTATWATSPSTTPATGASAWNKPLQNPNTPSQTQRKTLQQIQKEEEARKAKAAAALAAQASQTPSPSPAGGKRYADLASKAAPQQQASTAVGSGAWTTVGAGGKVKSSIPQSPVPPPNAPTAPSSKGSSSVKKTIVQTPAKSAASSAQEEFIKWCRGSIKGLQGGATPDNVIETLSTFPPDAEIIADTVYTLSSTMDGRRWAEEYIKRREAAGSGVVIEAGTESKPSGGWNEVAKGRPAAQAQIAVPETNNSFRVVSKKKGRRA